MKTINGIPNKVTARTLTLGRSRNVDGNKKWHSTKGRSGTVRKLRNMNHNNQQHSDGGCGRLYWCNSNYPVITLSISLSVLVIYGIWPGNHVIHGFCPGNTHIQQYPGYFWLIFCHKVHQWFWNVPESSVIYPGVPIIYLLMRKEKKGTYHYFKL